MLNYLKNWNIMRIIRLVLGIVIVVQGFLSREWLFMGLGAFFALLPLLNIGCCGTSSACSIPAHRKKVQN